MQERGSHAALEERQRLLKARKIEVLLGPGALPSGAALLDVGTGSGWIAHYFARQGGFRVAAVDANDERVVKDGYAFTQVRGTALPFPDASFDVVFSNHVIEHVGGEADQLAHLAEMRRVLKPGGTVYLAAPNRWSLVEPHYRLPFLSWLPAGLARAYLRLTGRGDWYDCRPLGPHASRRLFRQSAMSWTDVSARALVTFVQLERPADRVAAGVAGFVERYASALFGWLSPTLIFLLKRER